VALKSAGAAMDSLRVAVAGNVRQGSEAPVRRANAGRPFFQVSRGSTCFPCVLTIEMHKAREEIFPRPNVFKEKRANKKATFNIANPMRNYFPSKKKGGNICQKWIEAHETINGTLVCPKSRDSL
jgi:hypothetical protein